MAGALGSQAFGQGMPLYSPVRSIKDQGISVRGWGSGTISETDEIAYEGTYSIRVSTRNFFQGGILTFANPIDLNSAYGDKSNLLRFTYRNAEEGITLGGRPPGVGGPPAGLGIPGGPPGGRQGGGGGRAGGGLAGGGGGGGAGGVDAGGGPAGPPGRGGASQAADTSLENIRVILTTSDGKKSEAYVPVTTSGSGERGWRAIAVPLQAFAGLTNTNKMVKEIALSGDAVTTFYVGDVRTINDTTPISGDTQYHTMNLALGDEVDLSARGYGGSSILRYTWDFDNTDGIQIDAEGQTVHRKFRKPGKYKVTLTISDLFGLKKPYTREIDVTVNP